MSDVDNVRYSMSDIQCQIFNVRYSMSDVDNVGESDLTSTSSDHEFPVAILPINRALPTFLRPGIYQQFSLL